MANPKIIPALADLTQDIAGPVPLTLLQDWAGGRQDVAAAQALLDPFRIQGTVVASDTSGLSRMSDEMDLVEVISLISRPKEILHALGVAVGGRAIGTWVADNTEMYYPANVSEDDVVEAMWEAQLRVASRNRVRIGMCIHTGGFYEIGGGLYGPDADIVERLAEDHAQGGEILVTPQLRGKLSNGHYSLKERMDLQKIYPQGVLSLTEARGRGDLREDHRNYPHAFTDEFISMLNAIETAPNHDDAIRAIYGRFLRACAVVFVVRHREEVEKDVASMLDDLLTNALLETIVRESKPGTQLVMCGGGLAMLTFNDVGDALDFSLDVREKFQRNTLPVKIGIDYGAILFFDRGDGQRNLVGDPANTASKISEDAGRTGKISITERAVGLLPRKLTNAEPFTVTISRVEIQGFWV